MIQAAPLVLSFARAVPMLNKLVGAVGITELGNRVNNYIQENPEESAKIVSMIMPAQGIANALKNKSSEDVEEVEETEEVSTGSGVEERIREILREAGVEDADNQDLTDLPKDLEAKVMSGIAKSSTNKQEDMKEASAIIGLSGPGREKKIMIDEVAKRYDEGGVEEVGNPKFDFTKFYKNRRRKADGGAIGIEVLFEEKNPRQGLFMGGSPLEGQALAIYNSMKAYDFTDQQIADALAAQGLYTPSGSSTPETTAPNIINQQLQTGGGDNFAGGIGAFGNLDPNTKKTMQVEVADGKGGVMIKEVDTYLDQGGLRRTLDNKNPVNLGLDVKPMAVGIIEALMGKKNDSEFDPEGKIYGTFNNPNYKDLSFFGKIKADYSRQKELKQLQKEFELQEKLKKQIAKEEADRAAQYGATNYGQGVGGQSYSGDALGDKDLGFGIGATTGCPVSNRTGRGRQDYKKGGLATMFKLKG